jgi:hypothetical protein
MCSMWSSRLVAVSVLLVVLGAGGVPTSGSTAPVRQQAVAYLQEPTLIGSTVVQGPVLFTHDDAKMARGEPCTTVQVFDPRTGPMESIASFHCIPRSRPVVSTFTLRTRPNLKDGIGCVLTEYQFAGDSEGHGVPIAANAH